jgi:hypothetical protein
MSSGSGRQDVVGTGDLVGINLGCVFADKKRTVIFQQGNNLPRPASMDLQVFRCVLIGIAIL